MKVINSLFKPKYLLKSLVRITAGKKQTAYTV